MDTDTSSTENCKAENKSIIMTDQKCLSDHSSSEENRSSINIVNEQKSNMLNVESITDINESPEPSIKILKSNDFQNDHDPSEDIELKWDDDLDDEEISERENIASTVDNYLISEIKTIDDNCSTSHNVEMSDAHGQKDINCGESQLTKLPLSSCVKFQDQKKDTSIEELITNCNNSVKEDNSLLKDSHIVDKEIAIETKQSAEEKQEFCFSDSSYNKSKINKENNLEKENDTEIDKSNTEFQCNLLESIVDITGNSVKLAQCLPNDEDKKFEEITNSNLMLTSSDTINSTSVVPKSNNLIDGEISKSLYEEEKETETLNNIDNTLRSTVDNEPEVTDKGSESSSIENAGTELFVDGAQPSTSLKVQDEPAPMADAISNEAASIHNDTQPSTSKEEQHNQCPESLNNDQFKKVGSTSMEEQHNQSPESLNDQSKEAESIINHAASKSTGELDQMAPDASDEIPEVTDSLGLLAETTRNVDEEEDQEPEEEDEGDDEEDFDPDDESNAMTAEHSEDSNAQNSESDAPKELSVDVEMPDNTFKSCTPKATEEEPKTMEIEPVPVESMTVDDVNTINIEEDVPMEVESSSETKQPPVITEEESYKDAATEKLIAVPFLVVAPEVDNHAEEALSMDVDAVEQQLDVGSEPTSELSKKNEILVKLLTTPSTIKSTSQLLYEENTQEKANDKAMHVVNIVDLGSSSEDDVQEIKKPMVDEESNATCKEQDKGEKVTAESQTQEVIDLILIDSTNISPTVVKEVGLAKKDEFELAADKAAKITNTGGPTLTSKKAIALPAIKEAIPLPAGEEDITVQDNEESVAVPVTKFNDKSEGEKSPKMKFSLQVFSLDSDEDESTTKNTKEKTPSPPSKSSKGVSRCVNPLCDGNAESLRPAAAPELRFYDATRRRRPLICRKCADVVAYRAFGLIEGVKEFKPLLELDMDRPTQELVEISDSDSDSEVEETTKDSLDKIGLEGAKLLEEQLADMINETWRKYDLDDRLRVAKDEIEIQLETLEKERLEIDELLQSCQIATDRLRDGLYETFAPQTKRLQPIVIFDTAYAQYTACDEEDIDYESSRPKRGRPPANDHPAAKKPAIPLGFTDNEQKSHSTMDASKIDDDNTDIKVVKLSAEVAPADLPPAGELVRDPLVPGMQVYAMRNAYSAFVKGILMHVQSRGNTSNPPAFSVCKIRFEQKVKNPVGVVSARHMAYSRPANVRLPMGTRVIALCSDATNKLKRRSFIPGVIAETPTPVNNYRYLVFFDDGYAQYVSHSDTRVVCECSTLVWEEVRQASREFVREYLQSYPERPMVRLHAGQTLKTEWEGKWWVSKVIQVDASLVHVHFEADNRTEWIYRGSTRLAPLYMELQAAERHRFRPLPRATPARLNMPYVEYTRSDEQDATKLQAQAQQQTEEIRRQRAVAKKSTALPPSQPPPPPTTQLPDSSMSRVVYYTPKAAVKPHKMVPHSCSPKCRRTDVLPLKELRTYNPLARPLLSGWERQTVRFKGRKEVMYRAPCGRRLRNMPELHRYLRAIDSEMGVDLFDFAVNTHCLAEFVLNRCIVSKKDLSHGKENVPVPCVNYYDTSLPEFCSYNTERTPTAGVPLNLDPEFLCGCDCTDDCEDKSKCNCWKLTLDGARTIGMEGDDIGYVYRRLMDPVPAGIYECNSRCKCKQTCLNRVAQHPLQLKLQVFKTANRGWGIRALNDVPRGSFLCVYAGNLLTDATANLDGLNEGDEYLAELDYIEVVEQMKEGYEQDIPEKDKELDEKESEKSEEEDEEQSSHSEDERKDKNDQMDDDFLPAYLPRHGVTEFSKRLRKRDKKKKEKEPEKPVEKEPVKENDDCITISDDEEEVREPSRFTAQAGMGANQFSPKYKSVREHFGKDEACYIMDAKVQGNIGRYLNHSCSPNVFVQNVFVDTHDPRFPWVAFFALSPIRAGTELTWNYNYDVGSVPGKVLYCYCSAPNCRGRLL